MNVAAALALQSIPFAGLVLTKSENRDLFLVLYIAALGLLLSTAAVLDDYNGYSQVFGISVEALQE